MTKKLEGKTAVIAGGTEGIGIVDRVAQSLLAPEVSLRRLDRNVITSFRVTWILSC
jgi:hypothetical protein